MACDGEKTDFTDQGDAASGSCRIPRCAGWILQSGTCILRFYNLCNQTLKQYLFQGRYFGRIFGHRCVRTSFRIQKDQKKQKDHAGDDIVNVVEKKRLSQEAGLQMKALAQISQWKMTALFVSALGAAFTYAGFAGVQRNLFLGIPGILLTAFTTLPILGFGLGWAAWAVLRRGILQ